MSTKMAASMALLALAAAACGSSGTKTASTGPKTSGKSPYVVGISTDLSGPASAFGAQEATMAEMLFRKIDATGGINGHPVHVIVKDNANQPLQAIVDAKDFVAAHANVMMFGATATTMKAIESFGRNTLIVDFGSGYVPPTPSNIFSISPYDSSPLGATLRWLKSRNISTVGLISSNDAAGQTAAKEVTNAVSGSYGSRLGISLQSTVSFNPLTPDVGPELTQLLAKHPGSVISWVSGTPALAVAKSFTQLSSGNTPLIVSWANGSVKFAKATASFHPANLYAPVFKAILWNQLSSSDRYAALGKKLNAELIKSSGQSLDEGGVLAYDPVQMVVRALRGGGTNLSAEVKTLQNVHGYAGLEGVYSLSATDHKGEPSLSNSALVIAHVVNGRFVPESAGS